MSTLEPKFCYQTYKKAYKSINCPKYGFTTPMGFCKNLVRKENKTLEYDSTNQHKNIYRLAYTAHSLQQHSTYIT